MYQLYRFTGFGLLFIGKLKSKGETAEGDPAVIVAIGFHSLNKPA